MVAKLALALSFILASHPAWSGSSHGEGVSPELMAEAFPCRLSEKAKNNPKITLAGETHHTRAAQRNEKRLLEKAKRGEIILAQEGLEFSSQMLDPKKPQPIGIENALLLHWAAFEVLMGTFHRPDALLRSDFEKNYVRQTLNGIFQQIGGRDPTLTEAWGDLPRPLKPSALEKEASSIEQHWRNKKAYPFKDLSLARELLERLFRSYAQRLQKKGITILGEKPIERAQLSLSQKLTGKDFANMYLHARNKEFAKNISAAYCFAARQKKDLVVVMGSAHNPGVKELLQKQSKSQVRIQSRRVGLPISLYRLGDRVRRLLRKTR